MTYAPSTQLRTPARAAVAFAAALWLAGPDAVAAQVAPATTSTDGVRKVVDDYVGLSY